MEEFLFRFAFLVGSIYISLWVYATLILPHLPHGKRLKKRLEEDKDRVAVHEAGHAIVAWHSPVLIKFNNAKTDKRGNGIVRYVTDAVIPNYDWMQCSTTLAGLAAESLFYGRVKLYYAESDIAKACVLATTVSKRALKDTLPAPPWNEPTFEITNFDVEKTFQLLLPEDDSPSTFENRLNHVLVESFKQARQVIAEHAGEFDTLRARMRKGDVLHTKDMLQICGPPENPKALTLIGEYGPVQHMWPTRKP